MKIKNLIWLFPFILFFSGYIIMGLLTQAEELETPSLIGKQVNEAVSILSPINLNIRIIKEADNLELTEGTILSQTPNSGNKIKPNQSIFVVITKRPKADIVPNFIGLNETEVNNLSDKTRLKTKIYKIKSNYPTDTVISQSPEPEIEFTDPKNKKVLLYVSQGNNSLRVFPDLKGLELDIVKEFLNENGFKFEVLYQSIEYTGNTGQKCVIKEHRPLPGSLINPQKQFTVYLSV